jgi:hypothetical protein
MNPWPPREPRLSRLHPRLFDVPRFNLLAEDLQPIQDRIMALGSVPISLSADWLYQLAQINLPGRMAPGSSAEKPRNLAVAIAAVHASICSVGSAVGYQATKCRWYWNL